MHFTSSASKRLAVLPSIPLCLKKGLSPIRLFAKINLLNPSESRELPHEIT